MITRAQIQKQLRPGLREVLGLAYKDTPEEHKPLFEIETSDKAWEEMVMFTGFGEAPVKQEGAGVNYDDAQESYVARFTHETIALAFAITEEALEDNLYDSVAKTRAKGLGRAMAATKQTKAANFFNLGFSTSYPIGDAAAFFSTSHPTIEGNQSNLETAADRSESTLETACINISLVEDERGILLGAMPRSLHIPVQLQFTAQKILYSDLSTTAGGSSAFARNDLNALKSMGVLPNGVHVNHRFTDNDAWFLKTDVPNGTVMFVRSKLKDAMEGDFDTGNMRYKARERYSFGVGDWRSWRGNQGT